MGARGANDRGQAKGCLLPGEDAVAANLRIGRKDWIDEGEQGHDE
jgi:hypothetical protein